MSLSAEKFSIRFFIFPIGDALEIQLLIEDYATSIEVGILRR